MSSDNLLPRVDAVNCFIEKFLRMFLLRSHLNLWCLVSNGPYYSCNTC